MKNYMISLFLGCLVVVLVGCGIDSSNIGFVNIISNDGENLKEDNSSVAQNIERYKNVNFSNYLDVNNFPKIIVSLRDVVSIEELVNNEYGRTRVTLKNGYSFISPSTHLTIWRDYSYCLKNGHNYAKFLLPKVS